MNTLDKISEFFGRLGSSRSLVLLCLIDEFPDIRAVDAIEAMGITSSQNFRNMTAYLEQAGIIVKTLEMKVSTMTITKEAMIVLGPRLKQLKADDRVKAVFAKYRSLKS